MNKTERRYIYGVMVIFTSIGMVIGSLLTLHTTPSNIIPWTAVIMGITALLAPSYREAYR